MGGDHPTLLLLATALIIPAVVVLARSCRREEGTPLWSLGLMLGGAIGNLYDRVFVSEQVFYAAEPISGVRDFISMSVPGVYRWPIYNVADIAIVAGVAVFAIWNIFWGEKNKKDAGKPA